MYARNLASFPFRLYSVYPCLAISKKFFFFFFDKLPMLQGAVLSIGAESKLYFGEPMSGVRWFGASRRGSLC